MISRQTQLISLIFRSTILGFLFASWSLTSTCQERAPATYFQELLTKAHLEGKFNGNVLIARKGDIIYQGAFGKSALGSADSLHLNSVFRLASVSKQFTAMAIMMLKERGQLSYHQNLQDFIPEMPYQGVTVRHLLHHTSGLPDYVALMDANWKPQFAVDDPRRFFKGNDEIIDMLLEKKPVVLFQPGEKFEYSNTGYVMLASIIARVSGLPFEEFLEKNIFGPTGMTETIVYNYVPEYDENLPNRVFGIMPTEDGKNWISNDCHYLNKAQGDGGIFSTVGDLLRWDRILYTEKLVSKTTLSEALIPAKLNSGKSTRYGFGLFIESSSGGLTAVSHGGSWVGFRTYIYRDLINESCFILLTNNSSNHLSSISDSIKDRL